MMLLRKDHMEKLGIVFWAIAVGAYFFQFPFSSLSALMIPCLFLYLFLQIPNIRFVKEKKYILALFVYLVFISFLTIRSLVMGIAFSRVMRFAAILIIIPLACLVKDKKFKLKCNIFINLAVVKSLIIIFFGLIIVWQGDFVYLRAWAQNFDLGDIYFLNRFLPKIQVRGNALLVIAFFIDFLKCRKFTIKNIIILAGVLVAGNFAFMLALVIFVVWQGSAYVIDFIRTTKHGKTIAITVSVLCFILLSWYVVLKFKEKAAFSNAVRVEQIKIFLNSNPFLGDGIGCWVSKVTHLFTYEGDMYFELQTLYIYKQIGIFALFLYYVVTLIPLKKSGKNCFIVYLVYLFFSFWNPYCFDVTQIITILLLVNTQGLGEYNDKSAGYSLSSLLHSKR